MQTALVAYIPVLHDGYLKLIKRHKEISDIYVLSDEIVAESSGLHQEIRALTANEAKSALSATFPKKTIRVLNKVGISQLKKDYQKFVIPNDFISQQFANDYLDEKMIINDTAFLRWDERNVYSDSSVHYDRISKQKEDRANIELASQAAQNSSDWWRQVGAVAILPDKPSMTSFNQHMPTEHSVYADGDPRDVIEAGQKSELNTVLHAEQGIITEAARRGIPLEGADLYLTTFPCPMCSKQIAAVGVKRLFFASGHASLDGEYVLKAAGVELIFVQ